jgi:hypothetical protein
LGSLLTSLADLGYACLYLLLGVSAASGDKQQSDAKAGHYADDESE